MHLEFQWSIGRKEPDKTTYLPTHAPHNDKGGMTVGEAASPVNGAMTTEALKPGGN